jgi:hypothetical protein
MNANKREYAEFFIRDHSRPFAVYECRLPECTAEWEPRMNANIREYAKERLTNKSIMLPGNGCPILSIIKQHVAIIEYALNMYN